MKQVWKSLPGYRGLYEVSDAGLVRSLDRLTKDKLGRLLPYKGRMLKLSPDANGYLVFNASKKGVVKKFYLHEAVTKTFLGRRPKGLETRHVDSNKANCKLSNLAYGTYEEQHLDKVGAGTKVQGVNSHSAKLNDDKVRKIRKALAKNVNCIPAIAAKYGVSRATIHDIRKRKTWKHTLDRPEDRNKQ